MYHCILNTYSLPGSKAESIKFDFFLLSAQEYSIPYQSPLNIQKKKIKFYLLSEVFFELNTQIKS